MVYWGLMVRVQGTLKNSDALRSTCGNVLKLILTSLYCTKYTEMYILHLDVQKNITP